MNDKKETINKFFNLIRD